VDSRLFPVGWEHHESPLMPPLLDLLHDAKYREAVGGLEGYDVREMGNRIGR
jgi:hypothetical protein